MSERYGSWGRVLRVDLTERLSKVRLDSDDMREQINAYYRARGWSEDGVPLPETLARLGIAQYA